MKLNKRTIIISSVLVVVAVAVGSAVVIKNIGIKPENILINSEGQPIILDFGLALTKNAHRVTYANLSGAAGTPDYMSPEQIEGKRGDQRTDVYAVGIMLYELIKGEVPFHGDNN